MIRRFRLTSTKITIIAVIVVLKLGIWTDEFGLGLLVAISVILAHVFSPLSPYNYADDFERPTEDLQR